MPSFDPLVAPLFWGAIFTKEKGVDFVEQRLVLDEFYLFSLYCPNAIFRAKC